MKLIAKARHFFRSMPYRGNARYCPMCGNYSDRFVPFGNPVRMDARCFHCNSLERHRFLWLYLERRTSFVSSPPETMLHFAPEACIESRLKQVLGKGYLTADIEHGKAILQLDITDIGYPDESFDSILCSHVLEHVPNDAKAMSEIYRVLKPAGWALLVVPISGDKTFEDPSVVDPYERLRLFGQEDHVRVYGRDFSDRLLAAGFKLECITPGMMLSPEELMEYGIPPEHSGGDIYRVSRS